MPAYISEINYAGSLAQNFIEIRVPAGTDMSGWSLATYDDPGDHAATYTFGAPTATIAGSDVYVIDSSTTGFNGLDVDEGAALIDDTGTVLQFVSFEGHSFTASGGPADGATSTDIGTASSSQSLQSDDGGSSYYTQTAPNAGTVPCYAPGTMIETPDGLRAVETLHAGDFVTTLDHGPMPIRWVRHGEQPLGAVEEDAKPVLIAAGALGQGFPAHDLIVSPQHRILVGGHRQLSGLFASEAFAPAKSLTSLRGIRHMKGKNKINWIHFACDRHEVVTANGCLSESLLLGPMVVNGLAAAERQSVIKLFGSPPTPDAALNGPPARQCLKVGEVRRQIATCYEDKEKLVCKEVRKWDVDFAREQFESERLRSARVRNRMCLKSLA